MKNGLSPRAMSMGTCLVLNEYFCKSHPSSNFQISVPMSLCLSCYSLQVLCAENAQNNNITSEVGKTKDIPIACQIYYSCHCWKLPAHCGCRDMLLNCVMLTNPREIQSNQDSIMAFICLKKTSHAYVILFNQTWRHWLNNVHIRQGELSSGAEISGLKAQSSPEPLRGRWSLPRCFCSCWWSLAVSASPPPPSPPLPPPPRPHPSPCLSFPPCKVWTDTTVL